MDDDKGTSADDKALRTVLLVLLGVFVLRSAWVGDDAYVTLRTLDHYVHGRGLVYNAGERVQAFTHPLWLAVLLPVYLVLAQPWWTAVVTGMATTLLATTMLSRRLVPPGAGPLLAALPLSRAFVDFGTSGLENPLSHLLVVAMCTSWFATRDPVRRLSEVALCTGLIGLTRLDLLALAGPCLAAAAWEARWDLSPREILGRIARGLAPLAAWEAFALFYYGSLLPTSALAKLNTGLPAAALAKQGFLYLLFQTEWDPVTLLVLVSGTLVPLATRDRRAWPLVVGNLVYVAYVVRVGGDFMAGRFLTTPMVIGLVLLARTPVQGARAWGIAAALGLVSLASPASPLSPQSEVPYGRLSDLGVVDERLYYASRGGDIGHIRNNTDDPVQAWRYWAVKEPPTHVQVDEPAGYPAFYAHPDVHWVCRYGITDPILSRIPPFRKIAWRVGHFERKIPDGYVRTLQTHRDEIKDPQVARLYETVHEITAGDLWSWSRVKAIWRLNTGAVDVDPGPWRYPQAFELAPGPLPTGDTGLKAPGAVEVGDSGAVLRFDEDTHAQALDLRRREDMPWDLVFERRGEEIASVRVPDTPPRTDRLGWARVEVPRRAVREGYDAVRVLPVSGEGPFVVQYLGPATLPAE